MSEFKKGDRVYVTDPGLARLREIMRQAGHDPDPNHHGTVEYEYLAATNEDDYVLINFDDGSCAPYSPEEVRFLSDGGGDG